MVAGIRALSGLCSTKASTHSLESLSLVLSIFLFSFLKFKRLASVIVYCLITNHFYVLFSFKTSAGDWISCSVGGNFTPHIITVNAGEVKL